MTDPYTEAPPIDTSLVRQLVRSQFPQWAHLPVTPLVPGGWDHRSFRLGESMVVRLPSSYAYAGQVAKENHWLPVLAPLLPLTIPEPLALGEPAQGYPWKWAINRWIDGETAAEANVRDQSEFAVALASFLHALQRIDAQEGPSSGSDNFFRGGPLATYDAEARQAIRDLSGKIDARAAMDVWDAAVAGRWRHPPVWLHGDISAGNLLVRQGRLDAVIDFGMLAAGDPACDLAIAWSFLTPESRSGFRSTLELDDDTWLRGRGWALWKASIVASGMTMTNTDEATRAWRTIDQVLKDA